MTLLEFTNRIIQILCIRLTKHIQNEIEEVKLKSGSIMPNGNSTYGFDIKESKEVKRYSIQYWVVPFTGWRNDFKYINGKKGFIYLTKYK